MDRFKNNSTYVYNLNAIFDFICEDQRGLDSEITEFYTTDDDTQKLSLASRELREIKQSDSAKTTIKYDLIKMFMEVCNGIVFDEEASLGERLVVNTLLQRGMITEIEE